MKPHAHSNYQDIDSKNTAVDNSAQFLGDSDNFRSEGNKSLYNENNKRKTISPKLTFGVLLFLAIGTLIYGFASLSSNIYGPSRQFGPEYSGEENGNPEQSNIIGDLLELQNQDTDKDGLSDYDEMYIYKTSPYLPDTDSDGYLDKEEIDGGFDPLCPKGQDCRGVETGNEAEVEQLNVPAPPEAQPGSLEDKPSSNEKLPQEVIDELNKLTPDQVRELLRSSGQLTEEQLNEIEQIDDKTLMEIYREVLTSQ